MKVTADKSMRMTREHIGGFENWMTGRTGIDARKKIRYLSFGMEMFLRYARSGFYEFDDAQMVFLEQLEEQERFRETTVLREREVRDLLSFYFQTKEQSIEKHWYYRQAAGYISQQIERKLRELRYLDASVAGRLEQIYHTDLTKFSEKEKILFLESLVQEAGKRQDREEKRAGHMQTTGIRPYQRMTYQAKRLPDSKTLFYQSVKKQWKEYKKTVFPDAQRKFISKAEEVSGNRSLPENGLEERKVTADTTVMQEETADRTAGNYDADHARASLEHFYQSILEKQQAGNPEEGYEILSDTERVFLKQGQSEEESGRKGKRQPVLAPEELQSFLEYAGEGLVKEVYDSLSVQVRQEIERKLNQQTEEWSTEEKESRKRFVLLQEFLKKELSVWKDNGENTREEITKTRIGQEKEGGTEKTEAFPREEKYKAGETENRQVSGQEQERQIPALYTEKESQKKENTERNIQKRETIWQEELQKAVRNVLSQDLELYRENLREWEQKIQTERFFDGKEERKEETGREFSAGEKKSVQQEVFAEEKETVQQEVFAEEKEPVVREKTDGRKTEQAELSEKETKTIQKKLSAEEKEKEPKGSWAEGDENQKNTTGKDGGNFEKKPESETENRIREDFYSMPERAEEPKREQGFVDMTIRPLEHFYQSILKKQEEAQEGEGYESFSDSERVFLKQGQPEEESRKRGKRQPVLAPEELQSFLEYAGEGLVKEVYDSLSMQVRQEIEQELNQQTEEWSTEEKESRKRFALLREFLKKELSVWKDNGENTREEITKTRIGQEKEGGTEKTEAFPREEKHTAGKTGKTEAFQQEEKYKAGETKNRQVSGQEQERQIPALYTEKESQKKENTERNIQKRETIWQEELQKAVRNVLSQDLELYRENLREWEQKIQTERFFDGKEERKEETGREFSAGEKKSVQQEVFAGEKETVQKEVFAEEKEPVVREKTDGNQKNIIGKDEGNFEKKPGSETENRIREDFYFMPERAEESKREQGFVDMAIRPLEHFYQSILKKQEETQEGEGYESFSDSERVFFKQGQLEEENRKRGKRQPVLAPEELQSFLEYAGEGLVKEVYDSLSVQVRKEIERKLNQQTEEWSAEEKESRKRFVLLREILKKELSAWKDNGENVGEEKHTAGETGKTESFQQEEKYKAGETENRQVSGQEQERQIPALYTEKESQKKENTERNIQKRETIWQEELRKAVRNVFSQDLELYRENLREWEQKIQTERFFDGKEEQKEEPKREQGFADMAIRPLEHFYQSILKKQEEAQEGEGYESFSDSERVFLKQGQPEEESRKRGKRQPVLAPEELQSFLEYAGEGLVKEVYDSLSVQIRQEIEQKLNQQTEEEKAEGKENGNHLVLLWEFLQKELSAWKDRSFEQKKEGTERNLQEREMIWQEELQKTVRNVLSQELELYREKLREWEQKRQAERFFDRKEKRKEETGKEFLAGEKKSVQQEVFAKVKKIVQKKSFVREKENVVREKTDKRKTAQAESSEKEAETIQKKLSAEGKEARGLRGEADEVQKNTAGKDEGNFEKKLKSETEKIMPERAEEPKREQGFVDMTIRPLEHFYQSILKKQEEAQEGEGYESFSDSKRVFLKQGQPEKEKNRKEQPQPVPASEELQSFLEHAFNKTPEEKTEETGYERVLDGELVFLKQAQEEETKEIGQEVALTPKQMDIFLSSVRGELITEICKLLSKETRKELKEYLLQEKKQKSDLEWQLMRDFLRQELLPEEKEETLRQEHIRRKTELQEAVQTVFLQDLKQYQSSPEEWKTLQEKEGSLQEKEAQWKQGAEDAQKKLPPYLPYRPLQYMHQSILEKTQGENNRIASGYQEYPEAERVFLRQEEKETFHAAEQTLEHTKDLEELLEHTEKHILENVHKSLNLKAPQEGNRKREAYGKEETQKSDTAGKEKVLKEISIIRSGSSTVTKHLLKAGVYLQPSLRNLSSGNIAKQVMEQADPEKMVFPHREEEYFPWEYTGNLSFSGSGNSQTGYEHMQSGEERNYRIFHENITKQFSKIMTSNPMLQEQIWQAPELPEKIVEEAVKNPQTADKLMTHLEKESIFKENIRREIREQQKEDRVLVYQRLPQERNVQEQYGRAAEYENIPEIQTVLREKAEAFGIVEKEREISMQELEQRVEKQGEQIQQLLQAQKELLKQLSSKENDRETAKKTFRRYEERMLLERMRYGL